MKYLIISILFLQAISLYSQRFEHKDFSFEEDIITYTDIYYNDVMGVNHFYIIAADDKQQIDNFEDEIRLCGSDKHMHFYFIVIPAHYDVEKRQRLFLEFYNHVAGRTKLVNSKFSIVSDSDYTKLYKEILTTSHRYKGTYINNIHKLHLIDKQSNLCEIIND